MGLFPQPRTGPLPAGPIGDKKHQGLPCTVAWLWAPTCGTGASHSQACRAGVAAVSPECCEPGHPQFPVPRWVPRWKHSISHFGRAAGAGEAGLALRSIQRKTIPGAHQPAASMPVRGAVRSQQPSTLQSPSPPQPSRTSMNTMSPTWPGHDASQVMGRVPSWRLPWAAATTRLFTPCCFSPGNGITAGTAPALTILVQSLRRAGSRAEPAPGTRPGSAPAAPAHASLFVLIKG